MAMVESLEMRKLLCCGSMERELHISRKVVQELLKIPKALMERLTKLTDLNCFLSSDRNGAYLFGHGPPHLGKLSNVPRLNPKVPFASSLFCIKFST